MAFHGGLLGVVVALWLYARKINTDFIRLMDFIAPMIPIGLGLGRLGNFINQEFIHFRKYFSSSLFISINIRSLHKIKSKRQLFIIK